MEIISNIELVALFRLLVRATMAMGSQNPTHFFAATPNESASPHLENHEKRDTRLISAV
jgi:hypothetical protein